MIEGALTEIKTGESEKRSKSLVILTTSRKSCFQYFLCQREIKIKQTIINESVFQNEIVSLIDTFELGRFINLQLSTKGCRYDL